MLTKDTKLRFWCQKVLPLVYDDSLSYYELLNKVVLHLNQHTEDINQLIDFYDTFAEDVEEIIQQMMEDGDFNEIVADTLGSIIAEEYDPTESYIIFDYCIFQSKLYRANGSTTGVFDPEKWDERTVCYDLTTIQNYIYSLNAGNVTYDPTETYDDGTIGKEIKNLSEDVDNLDAEDVAYNPNTTYSNGTVGKELGDLNKEIIAKPNPNLFNNWYFVGGGSQSGTGKFPVNQRGQASYTANAYTIDRWKLGNSESFGSLTLNNDGLTLAHPQSSGYTQITQILENWADLTGLTLTFSAIVDNVLHAHTFVAGTTGSAIAFGNLNFYATSTGVVLRAEAEKTAKIKAVKLEIGNTQTLAHLNGSNWELNELPDFGIEIARCRRYYQRINGNMFAGTNSSGTRLDVSFPVDVLMRAIPNGTGSTLASVYIEGTEYTGTFTYERILETDPNTSTFYTVRFTYSSSLPAMKLGRCYLYGILDADL